MVRRAHIALCRNLKARATYTRFLTFAVSTFMQSTRTSLLTSISTSPFIQAASNTAIQLGHNPFGTVPYSMPPLAPTPMSSTQFSLHHPIRLMTPRPNTWLALETLIELVVVPDLIWALFYLFYLWMYGAVWIVKGLRESWKRGKGRKKWGEERRMAKAEEEVTESIVKHSVLAFQNMRESSVEDDKIQKTPKDTGTHGRDTARGRRTTL